MKTLHRQNLRHPRRQAGLTLIESLVVMSITATSLSAALPGLSQVKLQRQLDGAAAQLETDIQHARSLAVANDRSVRISFPSAGDGNSCYVVHTGAADACTCGNDGTATCTAGVALRSEHFTADGAVQVRSNTRSILFDSAKGTSTPTGTLRLVARDNSEVRLVVNIMGRVRSCSPTGAPGHKPC